jgi:hypothetical protein
MVARSKMLQSEAGYIDARPQPTAQRKTSCNARPDHTFGSDSKSLAASKSSPLVLKQPTYAMILQKDRVGPEARIWWACRALSGKTLNVGARHGGIASSSGRDTDRVDCARHSAVRVLPHVRHHRGYRLVYPANPEKRERALLAPLNVLFSRQRHEQARVFACHWPSPLAVARTFIFVNFG